MRSSLALVAAATLALAACGRDDDAPAHVVGEQSQYQCVITYTASAGPIKQTSTAMALMAFDRGGLNPTWQVETLSVLQPPPPEMGLDPWLEFESRQPRAIVADAGGILTLTSSAGQPLTFNAATGALAWSQEAALGETRYDGVCTRS